MYKRQINKPREIKDECEIKKIAEAEKIGDMAFEYILGRIKAVSYTHLDVYKRQILYFR